MGFFYSAYGLCLRTNQAVTGLYPAEDPGSGDCVTVWLGVAPPPSQMPAGQVPAYLSPYKDEHGEPVLRIWRAAGEDRFRLVYSDGTEFLLDLPASQIWAAWRPPLTLDDTLTYFCGPVLGFFLALRGFACLHASCVAVDGGAVAFLGAPGAGKSTTAAILAKRGFAVQSDDVVPLLRRGDAFYAHPGFPRVCLWEDSVRALCGSAEVLPLLTPNWEKRFLPLDGQGARFESRPLPLRQVYILAERTDAPRTPWIEAVRGREALLALVANTYVTHILDRDRRAREFDVLHRLALEIPLRRIHAHSDASRFQQLGDIILADLRVGARMPAGAGLD